MRSLFDLAGRETVKRMDACVADDAPEEVQLSDIRLKTNISRIGSTALGLPLYSFGYAGEEGVYSGVMAQDVLEVAPHAVSTGSDGFYRVNYSALGIRMERLA